MKTFFAIFAFVFIFMATSPVANADTGKEFVGYFYCHNCILDGGVGSAMGVDANMFTKIVVNPWVVAWITKDFESRTFSICNDSICQTYKYLKSGRYLITKNEKPPKRHKFKNSPDPDPGEGGDGGGGGGLPNPIGSVGSGPWLPPGCYGDCQPDGTVTAGPIENP